MKHGKAKSKAASKASGKKSSKTSAAVKAGAKSSKASPVSKKQQATSKISSKPFAPGNGKPTRLAPGDVNFANATVGNAFKRAVKKYPNTFRRLTD